MIARLFLLFTIVPLVETWLLVTVGSQIGPTPTVLLLLLDGILGAWLARREGLGILRTLFADLQTGQPLAVRVVEGLLVLTGAILLVTPGFLTDLVGYLLLFPPTRRRIAPFALRWIEARFKIEGLNVGPARPHRPDPQAPPPSKRFDHPVR